jgi:cysteinyl-tRNA synthetase
MAMRHLGNLLDIHGGGEDLIFPHHENERAQSLATTGKPLANLWVHVGFVTIKDVKMSKSLGNTVYLKDLRESYHPESLRVALLSSHYRSPFEFSFELLDNVQRALYRFYLARERQESRLCRGKAGADRIQGSIALKEKFLDELRNDLNTPKAIGAVFKAASLLQENTGVDQKTYQALLGLFDKAQEVLGAFGSNPKSFVEFLTSAFFQKIDLETRVLQGLIEDRRLARERRDFQRADAIRQELKGYGILIEDTPEGALVRLDI